MTLEELGYNPHFEAQRAQNKLEDFDLGRVVAEHKERYVVRSEQGEFEAEITGNLRYSAQSRADFPAVGDWVSLISHDPKSAIIHSVLPRLSVLTRQAVGKFGEMQIIAANVDFALLAQAVDRDFNINRLERYLTICYASNVRPIIVLTKTDLIDPQQLTEIKERLNQRIKDVPVVAISNETEEGYDFLQDLLKRGMTYCVLGSSGVGKSTLINNLQGEHRMETGSISSSTNKGRHTTTHRELTVLESGGVLIDNPGMREIGIVDPSDGLATAFDDISRISEHCKFNDCTHTSEVGCAVIEAVEQSKLDRSSYENYLKMEREKDHFNLSAAEKRKKDKSFGKMVKHFKDDIRQVSAKHHRARKK